MPFILSSNINFMDDQGNVKNLVNEVIKQIPTSGLKASLPTLDKNTFYYCTDTKELFFGTEWGNQIVSGNTGASTDTTAPNDITNLQSSNLTNSSLTLFWTASTSNDVSGYDVYNGSTLITSTTSTSLNITGLSPSSNYSFTVKAKDSSNNVSAGASISVTTNAVIGTPPVVTISPGAGAYSSTQSITLTSDIGATIYYTTDGSTPSSNSSVYSGAISISTTTTLKYFAISTADGTPSVVQSATFTINAGTSVTGVSLNQNTGALDTAKTLQLTATVVPSSATDKSVTWSSSNTSIATVDSNGLVTAVANGNVVITVTTNDGSYKASCNISVSSATNGFDFNNLVGYPDDTTISLDQVVNGKSDFVHPTILYFPNNWNGHPYWLSINPYPGTQGSFENPFIFYSDDGNNFITPTGATQPIFPTASGVAYNSDVHIFMDYDGVTMHCINRAVYSDTTIPTTDPNKVACFIEIVSSTDGITWANRQVIVDTKVLGYDFLAPSVVKYKGKYYMFIQDAADQTHVTILEATDVRGTWTEINRMFTAGMGALWHCEVRYINNEFIIIGSTGGASGGPLAMGKFQDVMDAQINARNNYIIWGDGTQPWKNACYRSSLVYKDDNNIDLYVGFKGPLLDGNTQWRVCKTPLTRLTQTLNLSAYTEVASYADNSSNPLTTNYPKYAIDFTITDITGDFKMSALSTTQYFAFGINSGYLRGRGWNLGETFYKNISYGLQVNDRMTMIMDDNGAKLYVNGRLVASDPNALTDIGFNGGKYGMAFGDINKAGTMSDIKVYMLPQYILDENKAVTYKNQLLTEYGTTPTDFLLVDQFNRANGTVVTSDNGVAYQVVGSPAISNDMLVTNGGIILLPYDDTADYSIVFTRPDNLNYGVDLYLQYTDANNYIRLYEHDGQGIISVQSDTAGTSATQATIPLIASFSIYNTIRIDLVGNTMTVYMGGVWCGSAPRPTGTFNSNIGLSSVFSAGHFDDFIIKKL